MAATPSNRPLVHAATAIGLALAAAVSVGVHGLPFWIVPFAAVVGAGGFLILSVRADAGAERWLLGFVTMLAVALLAMSMGHKDLAAAQPLVAAGWLGALWMGEMLAARP